MKKSGLTQGDRITGKVELWGIELSAIDCSLLQNIQCRDRLRSNEG